MGEAAARGGRLHPEILRNTRRQRFPHSLLFRGLHSMPCSRQAEEHHRDPGLIRVPIHALAPLKLKYPYMSASKREAAVRLLRVGKRLSESAD